MSLKVSGPLTDSQSSDLFRSLKKGGISNLAESINYERSELSDDYKKNMQELSDMKKKFYAEHPLKEDNPVGMTGFLYTNAQKERDEEWAKIEAQYLAEHPISDADKAIIEKELKRYATFMSLG